MSTFTRFLSVAAVCCAAFLPTAASADDPGHKGPPGHGGPGHYYGGRYYGRGWGPGWGRGPYVNFYYGPGFYGPGYPYPYGDPYYYGPPGGAPGGVYYGRAVGSADGPVGAEGPEGPEGPGGGSSLAADVQFALKRLGYYKGEPDGEIGAVSRAAIRNFQSEHGLPVTGRIDKPLLHALKLS